MSKKKPYNKDRKNFPDNPSVRMNGNDFLNYSSGRMTGKERNAFEKNLQRDPFESEASEGFEKLSSVETEDDLHKLRVLLNKRISRRHFNIYKIAAAIAAFILVPSLFYYLTRESITDAPGLKTVSKLEEEFKAEPESAGNSSITGEHQNSTVLEDQLPANEISRNELLKSGKKSSSPDAQDKKKALPVEMGVREPIVKVEQAESVAIPPLNSEANNAISGNESLVFENESIPETAKIRQTSIENRSGPQFLVNPNKKVYIRGVSESPAKSEKGRITPTFVEGIVLSKEDNEPLPGANLQIKGTDFTAVSDLDGRFFLPVKPDTSLKLVANFIGMEPTEVSVPLSGQIILGMEPANLSLNEVVVIGYGGAKKNSGKTDEYSKIVSPEPIGGKEAFEEYILKNTLFPESEENITKATIVLKFTIGKAGNPENISVIRSPGKAFSDEAIRLLTSGPMWKPGNISKNKKEDQVRIKIILKKNTD